MMPVDTRELPFGTVPFASMKVIRMNAILARCTPLARLLLSRQPLRGCGPVTAFVFTAFVAAAATFAQTPVDNGPPPNVTAAVVSIELAGSARVGSGVVVNDAGLIVTSYALAASGSKARLKYADGAETEAMGFVAARKGKDLILLKPKKASAKALPLKFFDGVPSLGGPVRLHAGPASAPYHWLNTRLLTVRAGDDMLAGLKRPLPATGNDVDTCWLAADGFLPDSGAGGAMLTVNNELLGMITATPDRSDRVHAGIHARHIAQLLKSPLTNPKPLASLKNFEDVSPIEIPESIPQALVNSGVEDRSKPLDEWISGLTLRIQAADAELVEFRPREDQLRIVAKDQVAGEREVAKQLQKVQDTAASIKPEVPRQERRNVTVEKVGSDGRTTIVNENRTVITYYFSARQKELLAALEREAADLQRKILQAQFDLKQSEFRIEKVSDDLDAGKRRVTILWNEMFLAADPLEIRGAADAERGLKALPSVTDTVGTTANTQLVKAILHLRLRQFDECEKAAVSAADLEKSLATVVQAIRGRAALLQGKKIEAAGLLGKISKKVSDDPRLLILQARIELDQGGYAAALRQLKQAEERGADSVEMGIALALIYATAPVKSATDGGKARAYAAQACEATLWRNSRALLALAAAHARLKDYEAAAEILDRAAAAAPPEEEKNFAAWKASVAQSDVLTFPWK